MYMGGFLSSPALLLRPYEASIGETLDDTRVRPRAAVERLLIYLLDGPPDLDDEVAVDLVGWLSASPRFLAFLDRHRDKVRKKLRGAAEAGARGDVRAELEVAFRLLADRRLDLSFEAYGAGRRGPDFTVAFRASHRFNLEVTRPRLDDPDRPIRDRAAAAAGALLAKLRQLPSDAPNALLVVVDGPPPDEDVAAAVRALRQRADRRDDLFFAGRGFADARDFHLYSRRLSALLVVGRAGAGARAWSNGEARRPLPAGALAACLAGLAGGPP
jgi:hypothetical protein